MVDVFSRATKRVVIKARCYLKLTLELDFDWSEMEASR